MFRERMRGKKDQKYCPIGINLYTLVGERIVMLSEMKHFSPRVRSFAMLRMTKEGEDDKRGGSSG